MLEDVGRRKLPLSNGIEIAVLDWGGSGPPLLMHHANGFCAALWDRTARELHGSYRVFAMDARGHGDSSKPTPPEPYEWSCFGDDVGLVARALAAELGVPRLRAGVGNSFGGAALLLASQENPPFEQLVLVDPVLPGLLTPAAGPQTRGNQLSEGARKRRAHWDSRDEARRWFGEKSLFQDWEPHAIDLYVAEALAESAEGVVLKCPPEVESAIFAQTFASDLHVAVAAVELPTCLARAGRGYFPPKVFRETAERMLRGEAVEMDAGHLAPMEEPTRVADLVREKLAQASGSDTG